MLIRPMVCALAGLLLPADSAPAGEGNSRLMKAAVTRSDFGQLPDGTPVELFTLTNTKGVVCKVMPYGATLTEVHVPDRAGKLANVVTGHTNVQAYAQRRGFQGTTVGRFANRIANGRFTLDGQTYQLATNNGSNHLHGGNNGFDRKLWKAEPKELPNGASVKFTCVSPDGDEGYPGTLTVSVTYTLTDDNELRIDYEATTDKATVVNLTNHSYWNLDPGGDVLGHELRITATRYTPFTRTQVPTGEIQPVKGTPLDFTEAKPIGRDVAELGGYDHNYVLDNEGKLVLAAQVFEPKTGRFMEVFTDQPGMQLFTGRGRALCLETQHYPDSVNQPQFPSPVLRPGETFRSTTIHRFATR